MGEYGNLSRRAFTFGTGAVLLGAGIGAGTGTATAASARINLDVASTEFLREKALHNGTVLQSFAFDDANDCVFTVQVMQGGIKLSGESAAVDGDTRAKRGDLCLTQLGPTGSKLGHMYLKGFGHGVSIGVEPSGSTSYIWVESDANPDSGYGRAISRVKYASGTVADSASSSVAKIRPVPGSTSNQPSVDMRNQQLLLRYRMSGVARYRLMKLADVKAGTFTAIYDVAEAGIDGDTEVFQGFAALGQYVYRMTGTGYTLESGSNPPSKHGNTYVSTVDLATGKMVQRARTEAAYSLSYREPEGMAIRLTTKPQLHMGFASGDGGARKASLYFKQ